MRSLLFILLIACSTPDPQVIEVVEKTEQPQIPRLVKPDQERYAAAHVLLAYKGATGAPAHVTRARDQAEALASEVYLEALSGADFTKLAAEYSDAATSRRGGSLGVFRVGTLMPNFEAAVASVQAGEIAPVTETPFGFHIIRRDTVVEYKARHIVVSWKDARNSHASRTKEEALKTIQDARVRIEGGADFGVVAREISEDATASLGGDLGVIAPGQLVPAFEAALMSLGANQVSAPVETPYGFHLIERL